MLAQTLAAKVTSSAGPSGSPNRIPAHGQHFHLPHRVHTHVGDSTQGLSTTTEVLVGAGVVVLVIAIWAYRTFRHRRSG